jgi:tetratricopeptide (TPR) repeat protein
MLINLAGLELNEGQLDSAKRHLALALRNEPNQSLAILNLASVAIRQNDFIAAHDLLDRATKMPLIEARAYELLGVLEYKEKGRVDLLRLAARTGPPNWSSARSTQALSVVRRRDGFDECGQVTLCFDLADASNFPTSLD